jgi:hypothetical protein
MLKIFAAFLVVAALAMGVAVVIGGRGPALDNHPAIVPLQVASPADSFVVHDAPPAAPPPAPSPVSAVPAAPEPDAVAPAPAPVPDALGTAIEKLRATKPDATVTVTAPPDTTASTTTTPTTTPQTVDPLLTGPNAVPSIPAGPPPSPAPAPVPLPPPPPTWTAVTSQGVRWRGGRDSLVIDMGAGRAATVFVDPAFQSLRQEAANSRIDFLKQTILETFPPNSTQFRFNRDGSISMVR